MSNHHRNLRELFSSKYSKPFSNFPSDRLRIGKSPIAVGNFIQYAQKKNAEDKQQRNHTPVKSKSKLFKYTYTQQNKNWVSQYK